MAKYVDDTAIQRVISNTKALLGQKVDKEAGMGLSKNNYTDADKNKLASIESGAEENVIETIKCGSQTFTPSNKEIDLSSMIGLVNYYHKDSLYTKSETEALIDSQISSVYKPAGSVAFANLPTLSASVLGNVYNVTDSFTTTNDFVEGSGKSYPAGTNVAVVDVGTGSTHSYKFDVLSGFVDLSGYQPIISDLATIRSNASAGKSASDTIGTYGNIVTHNASEFQTALSSTNKVSADYVDDTNATNKFVTSAEKSTWNAKQNAMTAITTSEIDTYFNS